jgi:hypothetical protein
LLKESRVAVECGHGSASMMVMGWGGAMQAGEGTKSVEQERCVGARASAARKRKRKGRGRRTLSVNGKNSPRLPPLDL